MKRLIFAALVVAGPVAAYELAPGPYEADILRILDGDTIEVRIHVWLGLHATTFVRLTGIDTPEVYGGCPGERAAAQAAHDHLARLLAGGHVLVTEVRPDKYSGRVDAAMRLPDGTDVAAALVAAGHARPSKGKRERWCR